VKVITDVPLIRVVLDADHKGVPAICLDMFGRYVLFRCPEASTPEEGHIEASRDEDMMIDLIGQMFGEMLLQRFPNLAEMGWSIKEPNREIDYHGPVYDQIGDL